MPGLHEDSPSDKLRPRMPAWSRKLVLLIALALIPVQGIAATISPLLCRNDAAGHGAPPVNAVDGHDHGARYDARQSDGGTASAQVDHPCCHPASCWLPSVTPSAGTPPFPAWIAVLDLPQSLHFPELYGRPPLA